jgi:pyrroloquinoline quinone biosynthesis protein D
VTSVLRTTTRLRLARHARLRWDPVRERHVLLAPEGLLVLNHTGATILELCDGQRTVDQITAELHSRYDGPVDDEVREFLTRLVARRWLEHGDG